MTTKEFFRPKTWKIVLVIVLTLYSVIFAIGNFPAAGTKLFESEHVRSHITSTFTIGPAWVLFATVTHVMTREEACAGWAEGFCDAEIHPEFSIPPALAYTLMVVSSILYWYLIVSLISWLVSLSKKHRTKTSVVKT